MKHTLAAISLLLAAAGADAHDTWFQALSVQPGSAVLSLGTGTRFPQHQFPIGTEHLRSSGCRGTDGRAMRLVPVREAPAALLLQASGRNGGAQGMSCWAQLQPSEIELAPETVKLYLDEIHATDAVRQAWSAMQARGVAWKERYVKHARIEAGSGPAVLGPTGMGMDILLEGGLRVLRAGDALGFQVLRAGRPLPDQPMELVDGQGQSGGWATSDAEGRVRFTVPTAGPWLLRGTQLQPSSSDPDVWESAFVTLAFEVR
jgi:hypothetical protein